MYRKRGYPIKDSSPPHIKALREQLCAEFITSGTFDPDILVALAAYAKSMRGRSDTQNKRKKPDDISVRPVIDSRAISPKYAAYLVRQRAIADRDNRGGPDEPLIGAT